MRQLGRLVLTEAARETEGKCFQRAQNELMAVAACNCCAVWEGSVGVSGQIQAWPSVLVDIERFKQAGYTRPRLYACSMNDRQVGNI